MGKLEIIKCFSHNAWDELEDASRYIELACKWKLDDRAIADMYYGLANEEISHFERIWQRANNYVMEFSQDDPAKYVWEWQSEDLMDRNVLVTSRISQY